MRVARQWRSDRALASCQDLTFFHVSTFARRFAEPFLPDHARHVTLENMMEMEKRAPVDVAGNRHALFLGRLTEEKGVLLLAEAVKRAEMPVRFVGEGPMAGKITHINPKAELAGWVPADKVGDEFAQARVLVAPSLWLETGPMTVCEAAAAGLPAIVSDRMGAADWVQDGVSGRHVAQGDVYALEMALREAGTAAAEWGRNSHRLYWDKPFTLDRHIEHLTMAYSGRLTGEAVA